MGNGTPPFYTQIFFNFFKLNSSPPPPPPFQQIHPSSFKSARQDISGDGLYTGISKPRLLFRTFGYKMF
jgi:hypothetical protein